MTAQITKRTLGKSGPVIGAMGLGTWALGGPFFSGEGCHYPTGAPLGYGKADDAESKRAIQAAVAMGIKLFDTADAYGTGHGERVLGEALKGNRSNVLIATKFGNTYDERTKQLTGIDATPRYIRSACEASLCRLGTDWIDLYQLHVGDLSLEQAASVADALDDLCKDGLIRYYGWSTDDPVRGRAFADRANAVAVQFDMNVFEDAQAMLDVCCKSGFAAIARVPLAMGFLSGKFTPDSTLASDDIRSKPPGWLRYFGEGGRASTEWLARLDTIKEILTTNGRSLVQGALAWVWARDALTVPIPGVRTQAQVEENVGAMDFGPLSPGQMAEIDKILGRTQGFRG